MELGETEQKCVQGECNVHLTGACSSELATDSKRSDMRVDLDIASDCRGTSCCSSVMTRRAVDEDERRKRPSALPLRVAGRTWMSGELGCEEMMC